MIAYYIFAVVLLTISWFGFCRIQGMYAETFLSRTEFEKMFDLKLYEEVREKYSCKDAFPHVYDKVSRVARVP
jgi:hypothetical protein